MRGHEDADVVRVALGSLAGLRVPHVVAFGDVLWRSLAPAAAPDTLRAFSAIEGPDGLRAPATQGDLMFWI